MFCAFGVGGCGPSGKNPSLLVFWVDGLESSGLDCSSASPMIEPADILCQEFVRFQKAYKVSTSYEANLASLMTGLMPRSHGLRLAGIHHLAASSVTWSELAYRNSYHTFFLVSGPPLTRRSGLQQGFLTFDDQYPTGPNQYHRDLSSLQSLLPEILLQNKGEPFAGVIQVSDILFSPHRPEATVKVVQFLESQFRFLKRQKMWAQTHILVLGFPLGEQSEWSASQTESSTMGFSAMGFDHTELKSRNANTPLFWKPSHESKEIMSGFDWEENLDLSDVGFSLQKLFQGSVKDPLASEKSTNGQSTNDQPTSEQQTEELAVNLLPLLKDPSTRTLSDRVLWMESVSLAGGIALRWREWLYLYPKRWIFHVLTDREEHAPMDRETVVSKIYEKAKITEEILNLEYQEAKALGSMIPSHQKPNSKNGNSSLKLSKKCFVQGDWAEEIRQRPECLDSRMRNFSLLLKSNMISKASWDRWVEQEKWDRKLWDVQKKLGYPWSAMIYPGDSPSVLEQFFQSSQGQKIQKGL